MYLSGRWWYTSNYALCKKMPTMMIHAHVSMVMFTNTQDPQINFK